LRFLVAEVDIYNRQGDGCEFFEYSIRRAVDGHLRAQQIRDILYARSSGGGILLCYTKPLQ